MATLMKRIQTTSYLPCNSLGAVSLALETLKVTCFGSLSELKKESALIS